MVISILKSLKRTSLVVQWFRIYSPIAGDTNSIPGEDQILHAMWCQQEKKKKALEKRKISCL